MEFPANVYPFLNLERLGAAVDWADPVDGRLPLEAFAAKVTPRTRLIAVSFVQFLAGFRADLAALGAFCRERDIRLVVDGIQGLGAVPFDLAETPVDALSCGGAKWMMWPQGTGFLYLSPAMLEAVRPVHAGWLGVKDAWNFRDYRLEFLDTAERFEGGTLNWLGYALAFERMEQFLRLGREAMWARVRMLADRLADGFQALGMEIVTPLAPGERSGIVTIRVPEPEKVLQRLASAGIVLSLREGVLRFSPHVGNTEEDIDRALKALKANR
jgi:selenocysteine lyase/cysteine desulfurase